MDNRQIIQHFLSEWAMRSPDGLAGGHDTPENLEVLRDILMENGMPQNEVEEISALMEKNPSSKAVSKASKSSVPRDISNSEERDDPRFSAEINADLRHYASPEGKAVRKDDVEHVKDAIANYDKSGKFSSLYNSLTLTQAMAAYGRADLAPIINAIDKRERKGLGRGELVFLFMLKDYKSGGTADVDLLYAEASGNIEMKELTGKSKQKVMKISSSTLNGYNASDFKAAIDELAVALHKEPKLAPFLERVFTGTKTGSNEPLYPSPDSKNITSVQIAGLESFLKDRRTTEMSAGLFNALGILVQKLALSNKNTPKDTVSAARANIVIGKDNQEFRVENPLDVKKDMEDVSTNPKQKTDINLKVSLGATKNDAELEQFAKNLEFFSKKYTPAKISKEMTELISSKYSGLLVIDKRGKNSAEFYPKGTPFKFLGITLNGIRVAPEGEGVSGEEADKD